MVQQLNLYWYYFKKYQQKGESIKPHKIIVSEVRWPDGELRYIFILENGLQGIAKNEREIRRLLALQGIDDKNIIVNYLDPKKRPFKKKAPLHGKANNSNIPVKINSNKPKTKKGKLIQALRVEHTLDELIDLTGFTRSGLLRTILRLKKEEGMKIFKSDDKKYMVYD